MSLPSEKAVRDLLAGLLGKEIDVFPSDPVPTAPVDLFSVAVYATDSLKAVALFVCDLELSVYLGSALSLLPSGGAKDAVANKTLSDEMFENLYEILNVGASMFNRANNPHVKLYHVYRPDDALPQDIRHWISRRGGRLDLSADVPGYGSGVLGIVDAEI